ncbi:ribulose-phosphate 3-epimerase [soil metagenome]
MAIICPTVTAYDTHEYRDQINRIKPFAERIHIDLMDGDFAPTRSPDLEEIWWPHHLTADIHLMYRRPMDYIAKLIELKPNMVIVHAEAEVHHMHFVAELHRRDIKAGIAILQHTPIENIEQILHSFDHALVFSGNLGFHGGETDLGLLQKVKAIKEHHPEVAIGWDGGIHNGNARQLIEGGVDILNVGGFIQKAPDAKGAYATLVSIANGN